MEERFGKSNMLLVLVPQSDPAVERAFTEELEQQPFVRSVTSLDGMLPEGVPESFLPEDLTSQLHNDGDTAGSSPPCAPRVRATMPSSAPMRSGKSPTNTMTRATLWARITCHPGHEGDHLQRLWHCQRHLHSGCSAGGLCHLPVGSHGADGHCPRRDRTSFSIWRCPISGARNSPSWAT